MNQITILGAGAMGSALASAMVRAGWRTHLWGTWLDDHLIDAIEAGRPHPRIDVVIERDVQTFRSAQLTEAMEDSDVVVMAVASVGVPKVIELALDGVAKADALWLTSKGFLEAPDGTIEQLPAGIRRIAAERGVTVPPIVAIGGPVKANECAAGEPTSTIFACTDLDVATRYAREARSARYCIEPSDDEVGVEICAPMKNVYAIMLGIADGLHELRDRPHHNLKAATFAQAVKEMSLLGQALGARPETAFGLAGVGDLEVTGLAGRNKFYGVRIGKGEGSRAALQTMADLEQTVEGEPAVGLAVKLVDQRGDGLADRLPLLAAARRIVQDDPDDYEDILIQAVLPAKP
ncbi:NAD(P)H-dependent glycerol-3-phosphate dehydrogenase [Nigerium massiliense]|uniref:NAD(P)H-dependent glycerol-3-phosphate dehydrogenase n=1 Tax=Nigerium massiliense TaxID=1522317 RepID=UPI00058CB674|nr:NAD(P)-binding domain-containing protein [Nigerium massiliense]